ncbi:MAG: hypothetical protein U0163_13945 [Gemmatimonadaceae bacterium]
MSRSVALAAAIIGVVSITACGRESAFAQTLHDRSVKGKYVYAGKGSTASIPWTFDAVLKLDGHGTYDLDVKVNIKDDHDTDTDHGQYRVDGERLVLDPGHGGEHHELVIRGDSLIADTGWKGDVILRMVGVPKPIFVKQ